MYVQQKLRKVIATREYESSEYIIRLISYFHRFHYNLFFEN